MKNRFFTLWLLGIGGTIAILPYAFDLQRDIIAKVSTPLPLVALLAVLQTGVLLAITTFFGLKLADRVHMFTLALSGPYASVKEKLPGIVLLSVPLGVATGAVIKLGDVLFAPYIPRLAEAVAEIPMWKTLLASFYGGIVEELLLRLFVVSLFVRILAKIARSAEPVQNNTIMWLAIVLASVLFGLGHLPVTAQLTPITFVVFMRAIILNGIGGLVFGWLFWKKGLESAMMAHFSADIVLLSVLPALLA